MQRFCSSIRRAWDAEDAMGISRLLQPERNNIALHELRRQGEVDQVARDYGGELSEFLVLFLPMLRSRQEGNTVHELELACTCLKFWVQRYIDVEGPGSWMTPALMTLCTAARQAAKRLDEQKQSENNNNHTYLKKLVEIHRENFQKLNKEKSKRAGYVWVCCELLRAYFRLGQVSQCSFLFAAVQQSTKQERFDPSDLPKSIGVTFSFYWGKHCVFEHSFREADEKLSWAFRNCPANAKVHRRKILLYLVPCKLRLGALPTEALLKEYDLDQFVGIVHAIREGNAQLFTEKMEEHAADFIKMGTYLLMMKLKFMVFRNLCKAVHREVKRRKLGEAVNKLDLEPFERIFAWQDGCDPDETACIMSNLIFQGAVKGYLSHEHRKIVFAKESPFPAPSKWRL